MIPYDFTCEGRSVRTPYEIIQEIPPEQGELFKSFTNGLRERLLRAADTLSIAEVLSFVAEHDAKVSALPGDRTI